MACIGGRTRRPARQPRLDPAMKCFHKAVACLMSVRFSFFPWPNNSLPQVFFQDDTKDAVAGAAVAANAALVADAVRCMPLPASRMPEHAVPLGQERFSACAEDGKGEEAKEPDLTVFLTRPCLSIDKVRFFLRWIRRVLLLYIAIDMSIRGERVCCFLRRFASRKTKPLLFEMWGLRCCLLFCGRVTCLI